MKTIVVKAHKRNGRLVKATTRKVKGNSIERFSEKMPLGEFHNWTAKDHINHIKELRQQAEGANPLMMSMLKAQIKGHEGLVAEKTVGKGVTNHKNANGKALTPLAKYRKEKAEKKKKAEAFFKKHGGVEATVAKSMKSHGVNVKKTTPGKNA